MCLGLQNQGSTDISVAPQQYNVHQEVNSLHKENGKLLEVNECLKAEARIWK